MGQGCARSLACRAHDRSLARVKRPRPVLGACTDPCHGPCPCYARGALALAHPCPVVRAGRAHRSRAPPSTLRQPARLERRPCKDGMGILHVASWRGPRPEVGFLAACSLVALHQATSRAWVPPAAPAGAGLLAPPCAGPYSRTPADPATLGSAAHGSSIDDISVLALALARAPVTCGQQSPDSGAQADGVPVLTAGTAAQGATRRRLRGSCPDPLVRDGRHAAQGCHLGRHGRSTRPDKGATCAEQGMPSYTPPAMTLAAKPSGDLEPLARPGLGRTATAARRRPPRTASATSVHAAPPWRFDKDTSFRGRDRPLL